MISNSIFSIILLIAARKCFKNLLQTNRLVNKLSIAPIISIMEGIKKLADKNIGESQFMILRGKITNQFSNIKYPSIYSAVTIRNIFEKKLNILFKQKKWSKIPSEAIFEMPGNIQKLILYGQDNMDKNLKIKIKELKKEFITTALIQKPNLIAKINYPFTFFNFIKNIVKSIIQLLPFSWEHDPVGEEIGSYRLQNGQQTLIIGDFIKDIDGKIQVKSPYLTKQKQYIFSQIKKKSTKIIIVFILICILLGISIIKLIGQLYKYYKKYIKQKQINNQPQQHLTQSQRQIVNCTLCLENIRTIIFTPCRHYATCKRCYEILQKKQCPYCKQHINDIITVKKINK